ncbi:MAG: hypothetical protein ACE5JA_11020 [bacterium]
MGEDLAAKFRNFVESVSKRIPGYAGYLEREERRESDKLLRTHLESSLRAIKNKIDKIAVKLTDAGSIGLLKPINRATKMIEKVADRIRFADYGYSGFFDLERIGESELEKIYNFDMGLQAGIEAIGKKVDGVESVLGGVTETESALSALLEELEGFDNRLSQRESVIAGGLKDG